VIDREAASAVALTLITMLIIGAVAYYVLQHENGCDAMRCAPPARPVFYAHRCMCATEAVP
jgi:hypothetical protein